MKEKWKKIKRYPYKVSNRGRVKSLPRIVEYSDGRIRAYPGIVLKPWVSKKLGYAMVGLSINSRVKTQYIHLLVADAFLPPKPKGHEVNHKDGNKANPVASNLEWTTHQHNMVHSIRTGLRKIVSGGRWHLKPRYID